MKYAGFAKVGDRLYKKHINKILVDPPFRIDATTPVDMSMVPWYIDPNFVKNK